MPRNIDSKFDDTPLLKKDYITNGQSIYSKIGSTNVPDIFQVGSKYELKNIFYKVENQNKEYTAFRKMKEDNLILINDNCACGSCPIISGINSQGKYRRLQEFLTHNKGIERKGNFMIEIPSNTSLLIIEENIDEIAYLENIEISIYNNKSDLLYLGSLMEELNVIEHGKPLLIDIKKIVDEFKDAKQEFQIYLTGNGYYETESSISCDVLLPINKKYY